MTQNMVGIKKKLLTGQGDPAPRQEQHPRKEKILQNHGFPRPIFLFSII